MFKVNLRRQFQHRYVRVYVSFVQRLLQFLQFFFRNSLRAAADHSLRNTRLMYLYCSMVAIFLGYEANCRVDACLHVSYACLQCNGVSTAAQERVSRSKPVDTTQSPWLQQTNSAQHPPLTAHFSGISQQRVCSNRLLWGSVTNSCNWKIIYMRQVIQLAARRPHTAQYQAAKLFSICY
jgi:hypothetical protein